jgi:FkbM family methyltransferase
MTVSVDDVRWCYENLLGRLPESDAVTADWLRRAPDLRALVVGFLTSKEFQDARKPAPEGPIGRSFTVEYSGECVISFAQNFEDVLFHRAFKGKRDGTFVDIGAGHPFADSVTLWLRMRGWRGVNVEPNPIFFHDLQVHRHNDINLNVGVSDRPGESVFYQVEQNELGHGWGLSSFDPAAETAATQLGLKVNRLVVPITTLGQILEDHCPDGVDILKIDVEGLEGAIIGSTDWARFRPKLICVESVEPNSARPSWQRWEHFLVNANYRFATFDGANSYYCSAEDFGTLGQLSAPVCCNDRYRRATETDIAAAIERS